MVGTKLEIDMEVNVDYWTNSKKKAQKISWIINLGNRYWNLDFRNGTFIRT